MKVRVIGSGNALNPELINSSFIIEIDNVKLLFDCGYNVFGRLKELELEEPNIIKDLAGIYISHMHDDHIGSVNSLIHYRKVVYNLDTIIYCSHDIKAELQVYLPVNDYINLISFETMGIGEYLFTTIPTEHSVKCNGLVVLHKDHDLLYISGDTYPIFYIEYKVKNLIISNNIKNILLLHDFSFYNNVDNRSHTCDLSINEVYSSVFRKLLTFYHNENNGLMGYLNFKSIIK